MRRKGTTEELANIIHYDEIQYSRKVKYIIVRMQESAIIKVNFHCDLIEPVLKNTDLRPLLKCCLIKKIFT